MFLEEKRSRDGKKTQQNVGIKAFHSNISYGFEDKKKLQLVLVG